MHPNSVTQERIAKAVSMVKEANGKMTRRQIGLALKINGSLASMIVTAAIKQGFIESTAFKRGQQGLLSMKSKNKKSLFPEKNWFEGWAGAPSLGLPRKEK